MDRAVEVPRIFFPKGDNDLLVHQKEAQGAKQEQIPQCALIYACTGSNPVCFALDGKFGYHCLGVIAASKFAPIEPARLVCRVDQLPVISGSAGTPEQLLHLLVELLLVLFPSFGFVHKTHNLSRPKIQLYNYKIIELSCK